MRLMEVKDPLSSKALASYPWPDPPTLGAIVGVTTCPTGITFIVGDCDGTLWEVSDLQAWLGTGRVDRMKPRL